MTTPEKYDFEKFSFAYSVSYAHVPRFLQLTRKIESECAQKIRISVGHSDEKSATLSLKTDFETSILLVSEVAAKFCGDNGIMLIPF